MRSLIAAELLKLRTTRMLGVAVAVVLTLAAAFPILNAIVAGTGDTPVLTPTTLADMIRAAAPLTGGAVLLLGLLAAAGEFRHHTIITSRLQEPRPARLLGAKLATMAMIGAVIGIAMEIVSGIVGAVVLTQHHVAVQPLSHGVPRAALVLPLVIALQGVLGVAIGALLRNTAAAVGVTLVWAFIIEGIIPVLTRKPELINWLPTGALNEVASSHTSAGELRPLAAAALLLTYATVLVTAAVALDRSREL